MLILLLIIIVVLVWFAHTKAKEGAEKIKSAPDPYSYEKLSKEPEGEEVMISCPDGTQIRAISAGSGKTTVVLAHGYSVTLVFWNILWDMLVAAGYRVIAFDLRSHGKSTMGKDGISSQSMASDYKVVLEHFDVRDGILVGHSTGGFLSCVFQLNHPDVVKERLKGAVFVASTFGDVLKGSPQNRLQIPLLRTGIMTRVANSNVYSWLFGASLFGDAPYPSGIRVFVETFVQQPHLQLMPIIEALSNETYYSRLGEIQIPCVILCGKKDKTTPPWHSEAMGKGIPNARNVWLEGKGHALNWEAPEAIFEAIKSLS